MFTENVSHRISPDETLFFLFYPPAGVLLTLFFFFSPPLGGGMVQRCRGEHHRQCRLLRSRHHERHAIGHHQPGV